MNSRKPETVQSYVIYISFILGLLTAIAIRALIVIDHIKPQWVRPVWYFAVLGNFLFFYYRFKITQKRKKAVSDYNLIEKIQSNPHISEEDKDAILFLFRSIQRSLENYNYLIIFLFSLIAIGIDIFLSTLNV